MLKTQKKFATYLKKMDDLLKEQQLKFDGTLLETILETELVVPVIGAFSAGKSSLLNTLIGAEILPVGIAPETELATELRYSAEPYLLAIKLDGEEERMPVEALASLNRRASEFSHLRLYYNSEELKALSPLVLVDMPGYGSSLENHNKAISYYLPRGVHFVVLTSVEDGNLTQSMLRNLDELKTYNADFTFLLSKCNLRAQEQVDEVLAYVDDQLGVYFSNRYKSVPVGNQGGSELAQALAGLNPEALFEALFSDILKDQSFDIQDQINLALSTLKKDKDQSDQTAKALEQALSSLMQERSSVEAEVREKYSDRMLNRCLKGVDHALNTSLDELVNLAIGNNPHALSNTISDIIRSSLTSHIKSEVDDISNGMVDRIATSMSTTGGEISTLDISNNWSNELADKVKTSLTKTTEMLSDWSTRLKNRPEIDANDKALLYKSVSTVLAVTTTVVNPLVELVIIFLPEILKMLSGGNERELARKKLLTEVFPNIKSELRGKIPEIINEQLIAMLKKISTGFEEQIIKQQHIVNSFSQETLARETDISSKTQELEALSLAVKTLANANLYK
jgi:GTP-binding protein EngB required for normal cell division